MSERSAITSTASSMVLVDSSGWIEFVTAGPLGPDYRTLLLKPEHILTPTMVVYEVSKVLNRIDRKMAEETVGNMRLTQIVPLTEELALEAARISQVHRLPSADAIIYATAQVAGVELATSDEHFKGLPGVRYLAK